jgi:hypothetical protein
MEAMEDMKAGIPRRGFLHDLHELHGEHS